MHYNNSNNQYSQPTFNPWKSELIYYSNQKVKIVEKIGLGGVCVSVGRGVTNTNLIDVQKVNVIKS